MKVLVTGADGFIGSHLVEHLVAAGHDVRAFTIYNSFGTNGWLDTTPKDIKDSIDFFAGDIRDPQCVRKAMAGCDVVFNLAALIAIPYSYYSPNSYVDTNISGALNVLNAARDLEIQRVVHTSTSEVYGTAQYVPIDEKHPVVGQSPYSATKIGADQLCLSYYRSFGLPVTIIRPFNTYGPRQSCRAVIPTIIAQLLSEQPKLKMGSLTPTRDFNFVKDTAAGFHSVMTTDQPISGETINLASNFEVSIGKTIELISSIMNKSLEVEQDDQRIRPEKSEVNRLYGCNKKAGKLLKWKPSFGGVEGFSRGLEETIEWFSDPENLKKYDPTVYNI